MVPSVVSIIVCTYNQEQYIAQTLDSILMQQCNFEIEVLVGEDCGTDGTRKICEGYAQKYPQVRLLDRPHNLGKQRNFFDALCHARGKYVSMCDGDDYWQDMQMLQKEVDYLENHPECVIVYHDSIMVDEEGRVISETEVGENRRCDFSSDELVRGRNISNRTICFRNIVDFSKIDITDVYNEDTFVYAVVGQYGCGHFMEGLKPSVYRILGGSIWNDHGEIKRTLWFMGTLKALWKYYKSQNHTIYTSYFMDRYFQTNDKYMFLACQSHDKRAAWHSFCVSAKGICRKRYLSSLIISLKSLIKCLFS